MLRRSTKPFAAVLSVLIALLAFLGWTSWHSHGASAASIGIRQDSLVIGSDGSRVNVALKIHSTSRGQRLRALTVAVRDSRNTNLDYPDQFGVTIDSAVHTYSAAKTFRHGVYTMFGAVEIGRTWFDLPAQTITVPDVTAAASPTAFPAQPTFTQPSSMPTTSLAMPSAPGAPTPPIPVTPASPPAPASSVPAPTAPSAPSPPVGPTTPVPPGSTPIPTSSSSPTATAPTAPSGPGGTWSLKFDDEFDGTAVDTHKWSFVSDAEADRSTAPLGTGNLGNQQLEFDEPGNCSVANGVLDITAKPDHVTSSSGKTYAWSSCMINSSPSYSAQYGYIEFRAQLPAPTGFWSSLWTWAAPEARLSPANGETDVFENYSDTHANLYLTQHTAPGGSTRYQAPFDPSSGYHTYGVDIEPTGTTWYIDGKQVFSTGATSDGPTNINIDNFVYSVIPPDTGSVGQLLVDYVRAWTH